MSHHHFPVTQRSSHTKHINQPIVRNVFCPDDNPFFSLCHSKHDNQALHLHNEPFYGEVLGGSQQKIDSPLQTARIHSGKLNTWDSMTKLNGPFIGLNRDVFTREPRCWETAGNCVERETRVSVTPVGRNAGKTWQEVSAVRNIPRECLFWKSCGLNEMCVCFYP